MAATNDEPSRSSLDGDCDVINIPRDTDVLIGSGAQANAHPANIVYRMYVDAKKEQYRALSGRRSKGKMISNTINHFKATGRFLEYNNDLRGWIEAVDETKLRKKVVDRFKSPDTVFSDRSDASRIVTISVRSDTQTACKTDRQTQQQSCSVQSIKEDSNAFDGQLQSRVFCDFLSQNGDLNPLLLKIYDSLFLNPTHDPSTPGPGICLSVDSCCGNTPCLSIHRPTYSRQTHGRDVPHVATNNTTTVNRYAYGTRSGNTTHGIPAW